MLRLSLSHGLGMLTSPVGVKMVPRECLPTHPPTHQELSPVDSAAFQLLWEEMGAKEMMRKKVEV